MNWIVLALVVAGCGGPPQVGPANYRLIESLRTAVSSRRTDWLEQNAKLAQEHRKAGQLDAAQFDAINSIIGQARAGQWEAADKKVLALIKAQRP